MCLSCLFAAEPTATAGSTGHPANAVWIAAMLTPWHSQERLCHGSVLNTTRNVALALPEDAEVPTIRVCPIEPGGRKKSAKQEKPKPQHAPKAPHEDPKFLKSTPARPLRILAEYINPLAQLKREGIGDTIVMFGSARIHSREDALARLGRLKRAKPGKSAEAKPKHRADLTSAKSALEMSRYYEEARALSHTFTTCAMSPGPTPRRFVGCSGGGPGVMEAATRCAYE